MTLVILFQKAAVMVGDLMASNDDPQFFDDHPIQVRKKEDGTPRYGAFPMQKIVRIQERFHIAYAAEHIRDARKMHEFVRTLHWPRTPRTGGFSPSKVQKTILPLINKMDKYYGKMKCPKLQIIISMDGFQTAMNASRLSTPVGPALVIGSGINDFQQFLQTQFGHSPKWSFPGQDCISFAASFFAKTLAEQAGGVTSLRNRWGWGMEMFCQGARFDRILYQAFLWEKSDDGAEPRFEEFGDKIFSYYRGDILIIVRKCADGRSGASKAGPLSGDGLERLTTIEDLPDSPRLTCTAFFSKSNFPRWNVHTHYEGSNSVCSISATQESGIIIAYPPEEISKRFAEAFGSHSA